MPLKFHPVLVTVPRDRESTLCTASNFRLIEPVVEPIGATFDVETGTKAAVPGEVEVDQKLPEACEGRFLEDDLGRSVADANDFPSDTTGLESPT